MVDVCAGQPPAASGRAAARERLSLGSLLFANFITGLTVLAPAAMLNELAAGLPTTVRDAGLLMTFGSAVLCFGSPLVVWATATFDRRKLMAGALAIVALGHLACAFAPNYAVLLGLRLAVLAVAAVVTPQAASTATLIVREPDRSRAIAFVFLGWSLSFAVGLPLVTLGAHAFGWRAAFGALAAASALSCALLAMALPSGLRGAPMSLASWGVIARHRPMLMMLATTALWMSGYIAIFTYLGPLLVKLTGATPTIIAAFFALTGVMGVAGNLLATRVVGQFGLPRTALAFLLSLLLGALLWALGAGSIIVMGAGAVFLGLGFAAFNSMQQARLVAAAPTLASASVALNTSSVYVGQGLGSGIAAWMISHEMFIGIGWVATFFMLAALGGFGLSRDTVAARSRESVVPAGRRA